MSRSEITQHSEFLKTSATLLGSQSPSTSAHLLSLHTRNLHENFKSLKSRDHDRFCGACGSLREPKLTKITKIPAKSSVNRNQTVAKGKRTALQGGAVIYTCLRCYRRTVRSEYQSNKAIEASQQQEAVSTTPKQIIEKTMVNPDQPLAVSELGSSMPVKTTTTDNANSKKRAKARKQGGLQALLAAKKRSQSTEESSSSLDLLDFLQQ